MKPDRTSFITPLLGGLCGGASIKAVIEAHQVAQGPGRIAPPKSHVSCQICFVNEVLFHRQCVYNCHPVRSPPYPRAALHALPLISFRQMKLTLGREKLCQKMVFFDLGHTTASSTSEVYFFGPKGCERCLLERLNYSGQVGMV